MKTYFTYINTTLQLSTVATKEQCVVFEFKACLILKTKVYKCDTINIKQHLLHIIYKNPNKI